MNLLKKSKWDNFALSTLIIKLSRQHLHLKKIIKCVIKYMCIRYTNDLMELSTEPGFQRMKIILFKNKLDQQQNTNSVWKRSRDWKTCSWCFKNSFWKSWGLIWPQFCVEILTSYYRDSKTRKKYPLPFIHMNMRKLPDCCGRSVFAY